MHKKADLINMTIISAIMAWLSIYFMVPFILFPKYLGNHRPVWEMKEIFLGEEYGVLRTEYFLSSLNKAYLWGNKIDSIFYVRGDGGLLTTQHYWLVIEDGVLEGSGTIWDSGKMTWRCNQDIVVYADVLADMPLEVSIRASEDSHRANEYTLDDTEDSISAFEGETGLDAEELLDTVRMIRGEYQTALAALSKMEYGSVRGRIGRRVWVLSVMWGIWFIFCTAVLMWDKIYALYNKRYEKKLDGYMEDFLEGKQ